VAAHCPAGIGHGIAAERAQLQLDFHRWRTVYLDLIALLPVGTEMGQLGAASSAIRVMCSAMMRALPFTRPVALNRSAAIVPARTTPVAIIRDAVLGKTLLPVPDDLDLNRAALVEPLAVGLHTVNRGMPNASTKAVVFGCGPIGLAAVLWLARRDVAHIVAIDLADERLDYAKRMGAHAVINPSKEDVPIRLSELHGSGDPIKGLPTVGTDVFYDLAAGPGVIDQITTMAKFRSRLVVGAIYFNPVPINFRDLILREMEITTAGPYEQELRDALADVSKIDPETLDTYVTATLPFSEFDKAFELAKKPSSAKVMVTFD